MGGVIVRGVCLELEQIAPTGSGRPHFVMLHEGLGSVAMWRDFPARLAAATGAAVTLYSRRGYGRSEPISRPRTVNYMHEEALEVLPALLDQLEIPRPVLFGHSDGASIALIHAGGSRRGVAGVVALAPHLFIEDVTITRIAEAREAYQTTSLRERLGRYHQDMDGAFWGWNDIWLSPAFRLWSIEEFLPRIFAPILAIQGLQDEYGTREQIDRIGRQAPRAEALALPHCAHAPHQDQPDAVLAAVSRWLTQLD